MVYKAKDRVGDIYALKTIRLEAEDEGIPCAAFSLPEGSRNCSNFLRRCSVESVAPL